MPHISLFILVVHLTSLESFHASTERWQHPAHVFQVFDPNLRPMNITSTKAAVIMMAMVATKCAESLTIFNTIPPSLVTTSSRSHPKDP
jgi:hypothetical protein